MSPPPRSLTFVVSTSLLTASLSLAGCDESKPVNAPADKGSDKNVGKTVETVNEGPETPPQPETPPEPEPIHVNPGPDDVVPPKAAPEEKRVNTRPDEQLLPAPEPEPKNVNTRPEP